ncbi:MAG: FAD-binding oxidoreductase [Saprospiraceae bacterium]|nr:FAD-binding oxidoreductase [Saprospiraceae bacterium]
MSIKTNRAASYWEQKTFLRHRNVIIIGSGIVGLTAALSLRKRNKDLRILVVDRSPIPHGASTKNAGFACFGSPSELLNDIDQQGWTRTIELVKKRWEGLKLLKELIPHDKMKYNPCGGYEVFDDTQKHLFDRCESNLGELNKALSFIGNDVFRPGNNLIDSHSLQRFYGMISCPYEAEIHPGLMVQYLIWRCQRENIEFINGLNIDRIEEQNNQISISGDNMNITSDFILLATNAFTRKLLPEVDLYPARNQVVVTSPIYALHLKGIYHQDMGYVYFRVVDKNRILLGGARNRFDQQERTDDIANTTNVLGHLENLLREKIIPGQDFQIDYCWSGILGLGTTKSPLVEWYSDRIFVACRMGGMGISIGALIGQNAADEITSR